MRNFYSFLHVNIYNSFPVTSKFQLTNIQSLDNQQAKTAAIINLFFYFKICHSTKSDPSVDMKLFEYLTSYKNQHPNICFCMSISIHIMHVCVCRCSVVYMYVHDQREEENEMKMLLK